ncbi:MULTISPECIES: hypothetical protein [Bacillus]|uniref:hypothetical protein n=1 Tax=Bacillus TaxID=1386 RepID=UPI0006ADFB19|nr:MULTISPECIES: hypothetical protein [Bacillus]MBL3614478.1 hypothetical protein [Bacillus sp. RHFS18]AWD86555.1 hypothetical protein BVQ_03350 [Bacillus velezensis]KAF6688557.1 hypothetical protein G9362_20385 [Bacillus sp. EKM601B]MBA9150639.1 hypothetical protein [Bacillus sp. EKM213B]MDZ7430899.1 hypothetical protein [Bacillus amyloliquefaciens]
MTGAENDLMHCECGKRLEQFGGGTCSDCFMKSVHESIANRNKNKEIKIWRGDKILCAFDKKDIAAINEIPGGSRLELADGSWFEIGKTVEYMKEILGVEEMK